MTRPLLLDLFCGAGGAAMGYHRAGFDVIGVDIDPQPHYPFEFFQVSAFTALCDESIMRNVAAIHASPPCQHYSDLARRNGNADDWPDLVGPIRDCLIGTGRPWVIENVEGAPLIKPMMLCGTMFPELRVLRHRLFEASFPLVAPPHPTPHPLVFTHDKRKRHFGQLDQDTSFVQVTGGGNCTVANARDAMGIEWMTKHELNEAIPPAYAEWVGAQLELELITEAAA